MRSSYLSVLQAAAIIAVSTWIAVGCFPLYAQVGQFAGPAQPGAFSETSFPVGAPIYLASNDSSPPTTSGSVKTTPPEAQAWPEPEWDNGENANKSKDTKSSGISSWFPSFKKSSKNKEDIQPDDGLEVVEWMNAEQSYSQKDYVESATRGKGTSGKDFYTRGMQAEAAGELDEAVRLYNAFIQANKKQTENGTLAAPYHRLALIAWKRQQTGESNVYFRYAMKYAQGGNLPIIAGDYSLFLMERGETDQAEVMIRNALSYSPENRRLLVYLGRCTTRQYKPIEAMRHFSVALGEERAYVEIAHVYRQMGEWEAALAMDGMRNEYLVQKQKRLAPGAQYASKQPAYPIPSTSSQPVLPPRNAGGASMVMLPPTARPPVLNNPGGMSTHQSSHLPAVPIVGIENGKTATEASAKPLPTVMPAPNVPNGQSEPANSQGWQPYRPNTATPGQGMPVSGVFHYPAGTSAPVYHERGNGENPNRYQQSVFVPNIAANPYDNGISGENIYPGSQSAQTIRQGIERR